MSQRTTVLFFHIASDSFGGASQMLLRLLKSIDREIFEPLLISQYRDELCERAAADGIEVKIVPFQGILDTYNRTLLSLSPTQMVEAAFRIGQFDVLARHLLWKADVVWCKNLRALLTLAPYAFTTRTPIIWNIGLGLESSGKMKHLNSIALRLADQVFIESDEQARSIFTDQQYEKHARKFTVFHKGINVERFDPARIKSQNEGKIRIGTAATLTPRKGHEYFIDAATKIDARTENEVEFLIAGETSTNKDEIYAQSLRDRVEQKGLGETIRFLGWVEEMPEYLASLDVFVLASLNEGIPGAVREALAMEVPVVATDVGGTEEAVKDGETGFLVDTEDADAIASAVEYLLTNPEERHRMGANGREHVLREFSMQAYVERYESFLSSLKTGE